jgi:hypothetical protein
LVESIILSLSRTVGHLGSIECVTALLENRHESCQLEAIRRISVTCSVSTRYVHFCASCVARHCWLVEVVSSSWRYERSVWSWLLFLNSQFETIPLISNAIGNQLDSLWRVLRSMLEGSEHSKTNTNDVRTERIDWTTWQWVNLFCYKTFRVV